MAGKPPGTVHKLNTQMSAVARDVTQLNQIRLTGTAMYSGRCISPKVVRGYLNQRYFKKLGSTALDFLIFTQIFIFKYLNLII